MPKRKSNFMSSALSIPSTFSCALDTFLGKTLCLFLPHLSNLAVRNEFTELLCSTCSRCCWNYCHFIFSRSCFRPEVSLSIIVEWQGSEMEDHVQLIGLVLNTMRVNDFTVIWGGTRANECIECSENWSCYFYMKFSRLIQITKPVK